jgi:class 3 adenylate cyclase/tetratricopeptide (TPR) repeat protein
VPTGFAERLLASGGQMAGQRRMVTILMSDVKGSSAMARGMDPEDVLEIMDGAFEVLIEPITRYEGTVARLEGDAIMAFFGAPIAHEDDPERACRAGLEIVEGAQAYAAHLEKERGIGGFNVRVGIHTGLVVVGEVGTDLRMEYTAMGEAPNLAARLESAAKPGTVLISAETYQFVAPLFETEALDPIEVKGWEQPVPVFRVQAPREVDGKPRGVAGLESPLVGRDVEFAALQDAVERLRVGVGGIVTLVGEAGIGKSRLVAEIRSQVLGPTSEVKGDLGWEGRPGTPDSGLRAVNWVEGRCLSYGTSVAYHLWLDVLRGLLRVTLEDAPEAATDGVGDALRQRVRDLCPDRFDDVYPYLGQLMSLPPRPEDKTDLQHVEGEALKRGTFRAVEMLIECSAIERPLALVCEDLHWADATTLELLERLLALTDRVPLLFVCVFRPQVEHGSWQTRETAARRYRHRHTDLWLNPLSAAESETLMGNLLRTPSLLGDFRERVLGYAQGNPFYVEEVIRSLIDGEIIVRDEATGQWCAARDLEEMPVPDTLHGVLMARIDGLPESARRVLQTAAVIGRIFRYRLLAAVAVSRTVAWQEGELDAHLLTLQREQMIRERSRLPELEYIFKHHLTQEAAYKGLLRRERLAVHRRVAEALEGLFPDRIEEQPELLAHHWERAQEVAKAIWYLFQAGERARRLGASLEAVGFYQSALEKADGRKDGELPVGRYRVHERLGDVYMENLSRLDEALEQYTAFMELSESEADAARAARKVATVYLVRGDLARAQAYYEAALARLNDRPPLPETSRVHYCLAYLFTSKNQLDAAGHHAEASLRISRQVDDIRGLADAHRVMGMIADHRRDLQTACECAERSLELYRQVGDLPRMVAACNNMGHTYRLLGQPDRALECLDEGLEIARRIGGTRDEATLLQTTSELLLDQGEWQTAVECSVRAVSAAEESGVASRIIESHRVLGAGCEALGRLDDARNHLEIAENLMRETQQLRFAPAIYLGMAQLAATQGEPREARNYLGQVLEAAGSQPSDALVGLVHRCRGHIHSRDKNWKEAVGHLETSLGFLEQANLPAEVARTRLGLGIAYAGRGQAGDRGRACEQLLAALSSFGQLQARGYVAEVEKWLEELGCRDRDSGALLNEDATLSGKVTGTS